MRKNNFGALLAALLISVSFAACGGDKTEGSTTGESVSSSSVEEEVSVELTATEVANMTPHTVTLSLYLDKTDENFNDYGVTWYVEDDSIAIEHEGKGYVQLVKKEGNTTAATVDFSGAEKIVATRKKTSGNIYYRAALLNLEAGAEYFWRIGNDLKVYGGVETLRVPASGGAFTFSHFSDSQNTEGVAPDDYYHKALTAAKSIGGAEFMVHTGDIVQEAKEEALWKEMLDHPYLRELPVMPISGNHDYWASHGLKDGINETYRHYNIKVPYQITAEGMYYSYDYKNCHFIMLNVGDVDTSRWNKQMEWLEKDLAENDCKWTVLSLHEPAYSLGKYGFQTSADHYNVEQIRNSLLPVIEGKVDIVLQGHDHMLQYTYPLKSGAAVTTSGTEKEIDDGLGGKTACSQYSLGGGVAYLSSGTAGNQNRNTEVSASATAEFKGLFAYYMANDGAASAYHRAGVTFSNITVSEEEIVARFYGCLPDSDEATLLTAVSYRK